MKKLIRIGGLLLFWGSTFALVTMLLRWKQRLNLNQQEVESAEMASIGRPGSRPGSGGSGGGGSGDSGGEEGSVEQGRALFEVPKPIGYEEFNSLLLTLEEKHDEYDQRLASLDEKERRLELLEEEISRRQSDLIRQAENLGVAAAPGEKDMGSALPEVDPAGIAKLAKYFEQMKDPDTVRSALSAMPTEKAVQVLMKMKESVSADVLKRFPEEDLEEIIDIMLRKKEEAKK